MSELWIYNLLKTYIFCHIDFSIQNNNKKKVWKWLPHHILIGEGTDIITTKHHRIENYDVILFYSL